MIDRPPPAALVGFIGGLIGATILAFAITYAVGRFVVPPIVERL